MTPEQVSEADVLVSSDSDKRGMYMGFGSLGIVVVFAGLMMVALHSTSGGLPHAMAKTSIDDIGDAHVATASGPMAARTNGEHHANGDGNGQHDADEDSAPAPI